MPPCPFRIERERREQADLDFLLYSLQLHNLVLLFRPWQTSQHQKGPNIPSQDQDVLMKDHPWPPTPLHHTKTRLHRGWLGYLWCCLDDTSRHLPLVRDGLRLAMQRVVRYTFSRKSRRLLQESAHLPSDWFRTSYKCKQPLGVALYSCISQDSLQNVTLNKIILKTIFKNAITKSSETVASKNTRASKPDRSKKKKYPNAHLKLSKRKLSMGLISPHLPHVMADAENCLNTALNNFKNTFLPLTACGFHYYS